VRHELIYHDAGAQTPEVLSVEQIRRLIVEAGREPIERDSLYRRVVRQGSRWQVGEPIPARA
jgi:aminodeoxyfutalosine synthase